MRGKSLSHDLARVFGSDVGEKSKWLPRERYYLSAEQAFDKLKEALPKFIITSPKKFKVFDTKSTKITFRLRPLSFISISPKILPVYLKTRFKVRTTDISRFLFSQQ
jgi:hypothetical protein